VRLAFSGENNGDARELVDLARGVDVLVAHNAVPEGATGVARRLHMPPSVIGQIAAAAAPKLLVISHRMLRALGREEETRAGIAASFSGPCCSRMTSTAPHAGAAPPAP
jgi:ribonuclease BN (tRNA processing enzyme)